ncbi:hypothetical protein [Agrobacterium vitis]|uniref:hypothetical protein n=1 Tax=Agrobacterium vitis TaxID=373 RepID=UPI0015D6FE1E|nr:hypothetical protein [Agrobacterium vitis]
MDIGLAPFERNMICSQYKAFQTQAKGIKRNAVFTEAVLHGNTSDLHKTQCRTAKCDYCFRHESDMKKAELYASLYTFLQDWLCRDK